VLLALALALALVPTNASSAPALGQRAAAESVVDASINAPTAALADVVLDGRSLTISDVLSVARENAGVIVALEALDRVQQSFDLLLAAAGQDIPIYGLNRGVGENKDKTIFSGSLGAEARQASERFNANNLRATSAGVGPEASDEVVRATLVIRLNTILSGYTGAQPVVAERYRDFINLGIYPVMPTRASVGEADITILSHIGLAMMGEGEVHFRGQRMPAAQALQEAGLAPLAPFGKDSLVIMSSNAYAAALAAFATHDASRLLDAAEQTFALSLEGLNGNVAPFLQPVQDIRPFASQAVAAADIRGHLEGSYLWEPSSQRALQDPLSFRTASHVFGVARENVQELEDLLTVQLNSSDDNPASIPGIAPPPGVTPQERSYYVTTGSVPGAVIPTSNFEPLHWVVPLQSLGVALSHVSRTSAARTTRLGSPEFTHLSRFLAPDDTTLAYSAVQKVYVALDAEIQELMIPVSTNALPVAGDIEDTGTNSTFAAARVSQIVDDLYYITGLELMHAAQAVDLRRRANPSLALGRGTSTLRTSYREVVPFLDQDRPLTPDIEASYQFLRRLAADPRPF